MSYGFRARRLIATLVAALFLAVCFPPAAEAEIRAKPRAVDIFKRINDERRARHQSPLKWDQRLADYAVSWSRNMARKHKMYHSNIGSLLGKYNYVGENVATGRGITSSTLHLMWMKSQGHRDNNLAPGFKNVGVGIACARDGSIWATVNFARPTSAGQPTYGPPTNQKPIVRTDKSNLGC